jgi:membrane-associated phospholipid phosphatase
VSIDWLARWFFIIVLSTIDAIWLWAKGVRVDSGPILQQCQAAGAGLLIALAFTVVARKRAGLRFVFLSVADFTWTFSQLLIYLLPAVALEYLAGSVGLPLADGLFVRGDALLGFDWTAFANWANSHWVVQNLFIWTYTSVIWQSGLVMLVGSATKAGDTNGDFVWTIMISGLICTLVFAILPALGNDGLAERAPIAALLQVRELGWHHLNIDDAEGLVTFPSFHTALGFIFPYAARRVRWVFWVLIPFNAIMIVSTVTVGGHYLIDLIAGGIVAYASIIITRLIRRGLDRLGGAVRAEEGSRARTASDPAPSAVRDPSNP